MSCDPLRYYQQDCLKACIDNVDGGLCILPTGSGKTHIIAALCDYLYLNVSKNILVIVPRRILKFQNKSKINKNITVMTWQEVWDKDYKYDILILDEVHLAGHGTKMKEMMSKAKISYGFTATPYRLDSGYLIPYIFNKKIYEIKRKELIKHDFLAKREFKPIQNDHLLVVHDIEKTNNISTIDFKSKKCIDDALRRININDKTLIFGCDIEHCKKIKLYIPNSNIIHSKLPNSIIHSIINEFKYGKLNFLINCNIFTIGFDCISIENIVILRPTESYALYEQMIGRGDRIWDKKPNKINNIYDYTLNKYNFLNDNLNESKYIKLKNTLNYCIYCCKLTDYKLNNCVHCNKKIIRDEPPQKMCSNCKALNFNVATYCKQCNAFIKTNVYKESFNQLKIYKSKNDHYFLEVDKFKFRMSKGKFINFYNKLKTNSTYYKKINHSYWLNNLNEFDIFYKKNVKYSNNKILKITIKN